MSSPCSGGGIVSAGSEIAASKGREFPQSVQLLLAFERYCEVKRTCPDLYLDDQGDSSCRVSGGRCVLKNCPKMRGA